MTGTARRLLVAAPALLDPNFSHTVVFMVEHTPDGALGVVLNRPTDQDIGDVVSQWAPLAVAPTVLFDGGPVQSEGALVALGRVAAPEPLDASTSPPGGHGDPPPFDDGSWQPLLGPVGSVDLGLSPDDASPAIEAFRLFLGYAGWGPGQLDDELDAGGWIVVDAQPADLLTDVPELLWRRVLRRQGGELAMVANQPPDPTVN